MNFESWTRLSEFASRRRRFDPSSNTDLKEFSYFKKNNKWRDRCPFFLEWPFQDISTMCNAKYADYMLAKLTKVNRK